VLLCVDTNFETPEFAAGVQRAFVKVGLRKKSDGTYTTYNAHHKAGWLQSCVPLERAMHVENQGSENQTLTFGEVATEFITEPVDATRIEVEHEAEGEEGSEHGEEELE